MRKLNMKKILFIVAALIIAVSMLSATVYAAFVYQSRAKRVVSTKASDDLRFSSNIMTKSYYDNEPAVYYFSVDENAEALTLSITVCNYAKGQMNYINSENIRYRFIAELITSDETDNFYYTDFKVNDQQFSDKKYQTDVKVLPKDILTQDTYILKLPKISDDWNSYSVLVRAVPENQSVTNNYMLCKRIVFTKAVVHTMGWKGEFTDNHVIPSRNYYAFNYRISGGGNRILRLSWNTAYLELNPEFIAGIGVTPSEDNTTGIKSLEFEVGKSDAGNNVIQDSYTLQFYRIQRSIDNNEKWEDIEKLVKLEIMEGESQ